EQSLTATSASRSGRREPMKLLIGKYQGTICPEGSGYTGAIDLGCDGKGNRQRIKRKGRTKEIVKDKLRKAVNDLEIGIDTSGSYTVENAVRDWLTKGTKGLAGGSPAVNSGSSRDRTASPIREKPGTTQASRAASTACPKPVTIRRATCSRAVARARRGR